MEKVILIIGLIASFISVSVWIPQLYKTIKTRDTAGMSILFHIFLFCSTITWMIYAGLNLNHDINDLNDSITTAIENNLPIFITNLLILVLDLGIFSVKIRNHLAAKKLKISEAEYIKIHYKKKRDKKMQENKKNEILTNQLKFRITEEEYEKAIININNFKTILDQFNVDNIAVTSYINSNLEPTLRDDIAKETSINIFDTNKSFDGEYIEIANEK